MTAYNTAQLAVYCVLALPIVYLIFRHGRNGVLGYLYLFVFAGLRIIGAAMGLKKTSDGLPSTGAIVISNIGLSPLLLASIGILRSNSSTTTHHLQPTNFQSSVAFFAAQISGLLLI
jgi:hypothetical protein